MDEKRKARIEKRLSENAPYVTPGEWYHEDVPMLLREIEIALKECPNGGNDGYITPRPCQLIPDSLTDSELTITDKDDQLQVALNALELAERESETLKAENEKLNETLAIYKNRYDVCNEY